MITLWKEEQAGVTYPEGFVVAAVRCGLKTEGEDLALLVSDSMATVAGVFTTNCVQAACVRYSRRVVRSSGVARAVLINAGNANACNGERGEADNRSLAEWTSRLLNVAPDAVLTASTGVIGHPLPMDRLQKGIPEAVEALDRSAEADARAACAIMTTDTFPKYRAVQADSNHWVAPIRFGGMCKGAGMIAPHMATMLAFLTTDARLPGPLLQEALRRAVEPSFNSVTVDGDMSTNDMCLLLASGMGEAEISREGEAFEDFVDALTRLATALAKEIARDGEGATKLVTITVQGAPTKAVAKTVAKTVAESPLVKTALFGCDPNWGRLLAAAGRAGVQLDPERIDGFIGPYKVCAQGGSVPFDREGAHAYLKGKEVTVTLDLGLGEESATVYTCDFSYDYVRINAEYHT
ncbi:MAG TPA: bifunctional glutamate N-acetyltransferase/amino-acid acetyltransferase ArgJ [Chthonomonas sp.]|jgi:glutamate N-acetyltransferase/amino-acid N-acetyltransferase|uniref:bifunctional glutamate N-acetyltransferase/amino-acid acetyltransferase ArgJ n=1 Tax=Chthonomonas sp. TaxID=2282153 RepID=UPI002B4B2E71|nr:bifunctional glutamate N-acetyltransferase/amino-acid acetyltransferase ArgJ [Chthonomonas sp.]HLH80350.1 bifunctional glutamate N-acetyltransferase/amino-acid acetyltransferase ArgJ [Chthonomonas sp.]